MSRTPPTMPVLVLSALVLLALAGCDLTNEKIAPDAAGIGDGGADACIHDCGKKECGPDGCGGTCGACTACDGKTHPADCVEGLCTVAYDCPNCADRVCGDDGLGGSCGVCLNDCSGEDDPSLCVDGLCAKPCCPNCNGKECGELDGCGGTCHGSCPIPGYSCGAKALKCIHTACFDKSCGEDDGFGVKCEGLCYGVEICVGGPDWHCEIQGDAPDCKGKVCGDADGLGGLCLGSCPTPGEICDVSTYTCMQPPDPGPSFDCSGVESVPAADFEVYSAAINYKFAGNKGAGVYVLGETRPDPTVNVDTGKAVDASPETVASYLSLNYTATPCSEAACMRPACLPGPFSIYLTEQILSAADFDASLSGPHDTEFYKTAYLWMSRIGYNPAGDEALVYLGLQCGGLCGEGTLVLLRKEASGAWGVFTEYHCWQS